MIDPNKPLWDYKAGDEIGGFKIRAVYGARPDYIIFDHEDGLTHILRNSIDTTPISPHLDRLTSLTAMARRNYSRPRASIGSMRHLGRILKSCLDNLGSPPAVTIFDEAELNIRRQLDTEAKLVYIKAAAILAIVWGLLAYLLVRFDLVPGVQVLPIVKGTIGGASRARLASIFILRSSSIQVDSYTANAVYRDPGTEPGGSGHHLWWFCRRRHFSRIRHLSRQGRCAADLGDGVRGRLQRAAAARGVGERGEGRSQEVRNNPSGHGRDGFGPAQWSGTVAPCLRKRPVWWPPCREPLRSG